MSSLEHIHELVAQAERELKVLTEQAQQKSAAKSTAKQDTYVFIYERRYTDRETWDTDEWSPNEQSVLASSPGEAFQVFGTMVDLFGMTVRNVCYGTYEEMQPELDRIDQYWQDYREKRKRAEVAQHGQ